jgi:hypothetical protein
MTPGACDASNFHGRLTPDHPGPFQLAEPRVAPDGAIRRAVPVVFYRPIIH